MTEEPAAAEPAPLLSAIPGASALSRGRRQLADVAAGRETADLVLRGGRVVEVHTAEVIDADIAIHGDRIAIVGDCSESIGDETEVHDVAGAVLTPGFIDCHMHAGESQLGMTELARLLVSRGTAAIGTCFYEAGIVGGYAGIEHCLDEARNGPLTVFLSPFVSSYRGLGQWGNPGNFSGRDLCRLLEEPECIEIREWSAGMEAGIDRALGEFINSARAQGKEIAGHLAGQSGPELQASAALGVTSDHETLTAEEAIERARLGIRVQIRQGSYSWDLEPVIRAITEAGVDPRYFMFCTDGVEASELGTRGHIEYLVRLAVEYGVPAVTAIQMATINAAEYFRASRDLGSLAPGRLAHVNVIDDLVSFNVRDVVAKGALVVRDGAYVGERSKPHYPRSFRRTMHVGKQLEPGDFAAATPKDGLIPVRVIVAGEGTIATDEAIEVVESRGGELSIEAGSDLAHIAVIDRHGGSGRIGHGLVRGFGISHGAVATTMSPALMNLMVVGVEREAMALAANRAVELGGGLVAAADGEVVAEVPLPILGFASDEPFEELLDQVGRFEAVRETALGSGFSGFLTTSGFTMMAVSLTGLRISERGLVRVHPARQEAVELFPADLESGSTTTPTTESAP